MKVTIRGLESEVGYYSEMFRETLYIHENPSMYDRSYIIDSIIEAQKSGKIGIECIDPAPWENAKRTELIESYGLIDMKSLIFYDDYQGVCKGNDVFLADLLEIIVGPETDKEVNMYFEKYIESMYHITDATSFNAVLELPFHSSLKGYHIHEVGDYITADAFSNLIDHNNYHDYSYVIHKNALVNQILNINAPKELMPHLIGKGGKRISEFKIMLKNFPGSKVRRINLIPLYIN